MRAIELIRVFRKKKRWRLNSDKIYDFGESITENIDVEKTSESSSVGDLAEADPSLHSKIGVLLVRTLENLANECAYRQGTLKHEVISIFHPA